MNTKRWSCSAAGWAILTPLLVAGQTYATLYQKRLASLVSQEVQWGGDGSELDVTDWFARDASRPRMIPGQTRFDARDYVLLMYANTQTGL